MTTKKPAKTAKKKEKTQKACLCPYCETEVKVELFPFCRGCGIAVLRCTKCLMVLPKDTKTCPQCGQPVK